MQAILNIVLIIPTVLGALAIILYATWFLIYRLRRGEKAVMSFSTWLRHLCEAVMGI